MYARSVRRLAEHSWSEENLRAVVETPQRSKTTSADIPPAAEPLALPRGPPEAAEDAKEEPTGEQEDDDEMQEEPVDAKEAPGTSSAGRGDKRTEPQENVPVKKRLMMKSPKRLATPVSPPGDPVKRRLLKKTDLQSSYVLMAVEIKDTDLLHTVHTLLNDKTSEEEKPWSEEVQRMKILSVLADYEEMMKGRQKELNSMGGGSWQTSDANTMGRSRDRRSRQIEAGSEGLQPMSGCHSARDVLTNTTDTVSENNVGRKFA